MLFLLHVLTFRWVCCDACSGWFHVPCLFLPEEQLSLLDTEKEYYCPYCVQNKIKVLRNMDLLPLSHLTFQEFDALRSRLSVKVEGLATVQSEFGGVTIPREMFEEKKNATTYNYTKEFPPTLRDLVARVRNTHQTVSESILLSRTECLSSSAWGF